MTPQCPKCSKYFTKRVTDWATEDQTETATGMFAYRCQLCAELFRARRPGTVETNEGELTKTDSRQYVRVTARFPATFSVGRITQAGTVTEIALGGCSLEAEVVLALGAKLKMELRVVESEPPILIEVALVRSIRPTGFGIQFMEIHPDEQKRLGEVLEGLLKTLFG